MLSSLVSATEKESAQASACVSSFSTGRELKAGTCNAAAFLQLTPELNRSEAVQAACSPALVHSKQDQNG